MTGCDIVLRLSPPFLRSGVGGRLLGLLLLLCLSVPGLRGQSLSLSLNGGYMMTNNSSYSCYNTATYGGAVAVAWRPTGNAYWQHFWRWPSFGVKGSYAHIVDSPAGDRVGLNGFVCAPLAKRWAWSLGLGLSAYTKPRSLTGDTNNIFIGSLVNCLIDVGMAYRLTDRLSLSAHLLHTSNGMLRRPNQGLNFLQVDITYHLSAENTQVPQDTLPLVMPAVPRWEWGLSLGPGTVMSRNPRIRGYYGCYDLGVNYLRYASPVVAYGGTLDLWYNGADRPLLRMAGNPYTMPLYMSAMAMAELFCGPLSLRVGLGTVVMGSLQISIPYYERVALFYNFGHRYTGISLNAHGGRVEFIEWTYGVRFRRF